MHRFGLLEFSELANVDNGSCATLLVSGCTDDGYLEFDDAANVADPSACITLIVEGCVYSDAVNYDPSANRDDGSCQYAGCTDAAYFEYSELASVDDGPVSPFWCPDAPTRTISSSILRPMCPT